MSENLQYSGRPKPESRFNTLFSTLFSAQIRTARTIFHVCHLFVDESHFETIGGITNVTHSAQFPLFFLLTAADRAPQCTHSAQKTGGAMIRALS